MSGSAPAQGAAPGSTPGRRWAVAGVFALAVLARVMLLLGQQTYRIDPADRHWLAGWETGRIAWHLVEGRGFALELEQFAPREATRTAWLAPVYPLIFAGIYLVFGLFSTAAYVAIFVLQIVVSGWTAVLLVRLGELLGSRTAGFLAGVFFAVWPPVVAFPVNIIWGTALFTALSLWVILLLLRQQRESRPRRAVLIGLVFGTLLLLEPAVGLFVPVALAWLAVRRGRGAARQIVLILAVTAGMVTPWIIRSRAVLGEWVFIKSNLGHELFIGNNPLADGCYCRAQVFAEQLFDEDTQEWLETAGEREMAGMLGEAALGFVRQDPWHYLGLTARRVWMFWRTKFDPYWWKLTRNWRLEQRLLLWDETLHDLLLVLAYLGMVISLKRRAGFGLPLLYLLTYPIPYYLTHIDIPRYRFPVMPLVILLAAYTGVEGWRWWRARRLRRRARAGC